MAFSNRQPEADTSGGRRSLPSGGAASCRKATISVLVLLSLEGVASAAEGAAHHDPVAATVLWLAIILVCAKIGGDLAVRLGQPAVLGELVFGVLLGNLDLVGIPLLTPLKSDPHIDMLSRLGVLILLFEVGLESTVVQMMRVGWASLRVAVLGVITPFALGWGVGAWLLPELSGYAHAFLGATLCATSVGITARVLKDLGQSQSDESRVILGAAVLDDVLGLIILAVVTGAIVATDKGGSLSFSAIGLIIGKATLFLGGALFLGTWFSPRLYAVASRLRSPGVLLTVSLSFCFVLAWLADAIGLAPIVGAFAAGLILEEVHFRDFTDRGEHGLEELIQPISAFLVPVFFVLMGMKTDLRSFARLEVLGLALVITIAALIGKQACSLGVSGKSMDRLTIGLGMIPRGEVGLIFANIGVGLTIAGRRIVDEALFSALVIMIILTTMVTPPLLRWSIQRHARRTKA